MARRRYGGYRRYGSEYGRSQAVAHINAARRLSLELGGTDKDVKAYFFALPESELSEVFEEYGRLYGPAKQNYAQQAFAKWRSGRVQMGGEIAARLYTLLPPRMTLPEKYRLTESLWRHVGPSSKTRLRVGKNASVEEIAEAAQRHIEEVVADHKIPDALETRFKWLAAGDVEVKQLLLNHLQELEKTQVVEALRLQIPVLLEHLKSPNGRFTHRLAQIAKVGKHELEIVFDPNASTVTLEDPAKRIYARKNSNQRSYAGLYWLIAIIVTLLLLAQRH